jgi:nucleoside transporter
VAQLHPVASHLASGFTIDQFDSVKKAIEAKDTVAPELMKQFEVTNTALRTARSGDPTFFYIAGGAGVLLGLFSFSLPHTPPPMKGKAVSVGSLLGLDAVKLLAKPSFMVFILCSLLLCIPLAAYYAFGGVFVEASGVENFPFKMTFGQMSEIGFMLVMPLFFRRLGVTWMLAIGMLAWVARYGLFAGAWQGAGGGHIISMVLAGIILHGICYDFFFVTGQIYTEQTAPKEIRAQAQGFLVLITQGVGMLIGNQVFGRLVDHYTTVDKITQAKVVDWRTVWMFPAAFAGVILLVFLAAFRDKGKANAEAA